jgi:hypothetical protein
MFNSQFRWRSAGDVRTLEDCRITGLQEVKEEQVAARIAGCLKGIATGDANAPVYEERAPGQSVTLGVSSSRRSRADCGGP